MRSFILFPLLAGGFAVPTMAQDLPMLRIEANAGYDSVEGTLTYADTANPGDNFSASESTDGVAYGATVGIDLPIGGVYLGLEAGIDLASNRRCTVVFGDDAACFDVERNLAAGARFGVPVSKQALLYAGAAWVNGKAEVSYVDDLDPSNNISVSDSTDGYRLSAGVEYRFEKRFYLKVEYRYSDYGEFSAVSGTQSASLGFTRQQVMAGIGGRF